MKYKRKGKKRLYVNRTPKMYSNKTIIDDMNIHERFVITAIITIALLSALAMPIMVFIKLFM